MSTTTTSFYPGTTASERSVLFLRALHEERFEEPWDDEMVEGWSQRDVSAGISTLTEKMPLPPTEGQVDEIEQLAAECGISLAIGATRGEAQRQLNNLRRRVKAAAFAEARAKAEAKFTALTRKVDDIPF